MHLQLFDFALPLIKMTIGVMLQRYSFRQRLKRAICD